MARIAIVDDDPYIVEIFTLAFERAGYLISAFTDPAEALQALSQNNTDLIILDLMMTPITGIQFLEKRREDHRLRSIPVLILSAWDLTDEDREKFSGDITGFVRKPILPRELIKKVDSIMHVVRDTSRGAA